MDLQPLLSNPTVRRARLLLHRGDSQTLLEQIELVQIPAPPLQERARAERVRKRFAELGLTGVHCDEAGNVAGWLPGPGGAGNAPGAPVIVSAHLDTVFPPDTPLVVRHAGNRIYAPGIADNARGLAAMLALGRVLAECEIRMRAPVLFVATVGEEGIGNLRGVKHLFRDGSPLRSAAAFVALDGPGLRRIVHRAVGSCRLRVVVRGAGGHSWADWGTANPVDAIGRIIAELPSVELPSPPRMALSATRIGGGTSINAIPVDAWVDLDLRGEDPGALAHVESEVRQLALRASADASAHRRRGTPPLACSISSLGDRPAGITPASELVVRAAVAATAALGARPVLVASSTDANVPISLGIPAITFGAGGEAGGTHTTDEWFSNDGGTRGIERALLTLLAVAGLAPERDSA